MKISECFIGIQGEGLTAGNPRLFIRTSGCNLSCFFCDTKYHVKGREISKKDEKLMQKNKYWCITGGEPLLQQEELLKLIKKYHPVWVEVETNGTIIPLRGLDLYVNLFNISPKEKRFQPKNADESIKIIYKNSNKFKKLFNSNFITKFVYSDKKSEKFIDETIKEYKIDPKFVWVMPEGANKIELEARTKETWNYCLKKEYNFSPRLHISTFGSKRGV